MDKPFSKLTAKQKETLLYGAGTKQFHFHFENDFGSKRDVDMTFEGVIPNIERRYRDTNSMFNRNILRRYMTSHQTNFT